MGRRALLLVTMVVAIAATACFPQSPPYWQPPKVLATSVSPNPVTAGEEFTVTVTASDDAIVRAIGLTFVMPGGAHSTTTCEQAFAPQAVVTVEFSCVLPTAAPSGDWTLNVHAYDAEFTYPGQAPQVRQPFTVVGGSDDTNRPVQESAVFDPDPVVAGSPFTATFTMSDEHPPDDLELRLFLQGPFHESVCPQASSERTAPTLHEWTFVCTIPASAQPGQYVAVAPIRDALGYSWEFRAHFDVVAAP